jgi:hypothetical protein
VADHYLIEEYLEALWAQVRWRVDAREVVDELRDHLVTTGEWAISTGLSKAEAASLAIERAGPVELIASQLLHERGARMAMPTAFTRLGGLASIVAGAAWPFLAASWFASLLLERRAGAYEGAPRVAWLAGALALVTAMVATAVASLAVCRRVGMRRNWAVGTAVTTSAGLLAACAMPWLIHLWGGLLGLTLVAVSALAWRGGFAARVWLALTAAAVPAAALTWLVLDGLQVGWVDTWGERPLVFGWTVTVGATLLCVGAVGVGCRLTAETAVHLRERPV